MLQYVRMMVGGNAGLEYPPVNVPQNVRLQGRGYGPHSHGPEGTASRLSMRQKREQAGQGTSQRLYGAGSLIVMTPWRASPGRSE